MKRMTILTGILLILIFACILAGCEQPSGESREPDSSETVSAQSSAETSGEASSETSADESSVIELSPDESSEESSEEESSEEEDSDEESSEEESSADESSEEESSETSSEDSSEESFETSSEAPDDYRTVTVTYDAPSRGETYTRLPSLKQLTYLVRDADNERGLRTEKKDFGFGAASGGKPHSITVDNQNRFDGYGTNALAWDNKTEEKVLYLTFDCGYQYGDLVDRILDTLKEKDVPAAFFGTLHYIQTAPDEVARMINEGHIVGNHTVNHPADSASLSREQLAREILGVENYLREQFGYTSKYFRFPGGVHSENAVDLVDSIGYRSVFWSIAHADWDPENQPGVDVSFDTITKRLHPGAVILLHSTSPDNVAILADYIDYCRAQGYTFKSLDEYAFWKEASNIG